VVHIPSAKAKAHDAALEQYENPDPKNAKPWGGKVILPNQKQLVQFSSAVQRTCSDCRFFDHKAGQTLLFKDKGLSMIVHDYGWKERHLCANPKDLGQCERRGALTAGFYVACEEYKAR